MPDPKPCARCKTAPRNTNRSTPSAYCRDCERERYVERCASGKSSKPCAQCKVAPRHGLVYCLDCQRIRQRHRYDKTGRRYRETCADCGKPRDGKNHTYCYACMQARRAAWNGLDCRRCWKPRDGETGGKGTYCIRCSRDVWLRREYGITIDDQERMLVEQDQRCAICRTVLNAIHIDHCHDTGRVRGILCPACNSCIGMARDNAETLRRAADYLDRGATAST